MSSPEVVGQRVLLVEDNLSNALTLSALLEDIGCVVDTAASLAAARSQLAQARYAVVLLDYHLGDGEGPELLPLLRETQARTPVVLLSGWPGLLALIDEQDFAAIHTKGADPGELLSTVCRLLAEFAASGQTVPSPACGRGSG